MKAIVIGSGTIGSAVRKALEEKGHEVVSVGRKSGDYQADISDPESLKTPSVGLALSMPWPTPPETCRSGPSKRAPTSNGRIRSSSRGWARSERREFDSGLGFHRRLPTVPALG